MALDSDGAVLPAASKVEIVYEDSNGGPYTVRHDEVETDRDYEVVGTKIRLLKDGSFLTTHTIRLEGA